MKTLEVITRSTRRNSNRLPSHPSIGKSQEMAEKTNAGVHPCPLTLTMDEQLFGNHTLLCHSLAFAERKPRLIEEEKEERADGSRILPLDQADSGAFFSRMEGQRTVGGQGWTVTFIIFICKVVERAPIDAHVV